MSAYTSRSLYEEVEEEQEIETSTSISYTQSRAVVANNSSTQTIVVALYRKPDTIQVRHVEKIKIAPLASQVFKHLQHSDRSPISYNMHVHFPGVMGLISPRTQLSAGFGFEVHSGESYCVNLLSQKDDKGNKCNILRVGSDGPDAVLESTEYHFGDMILKPGVRMAKRAYKFTTLRIKPAMYTEYRLRRRTRIENRPSSHTANAVIKSDGDSDDDHHENMELEDFDEIEVWGMFFDSVCAMGVRLCRGLDALCTTNQVDENVKEGRKEGVRELWITADDVAMQEPYLFIGLPACTLFMTIFRSFNDTDGIVLGDSRRIVLQNCPNGFKEMFEMLIVTKNSVLELDSKGSGDVLSGKDIVWMQQFLLYSSSDKEMTIKEADSPSEERRTVLRQALSHLVGVCIQLTQQPYFKENFMNVLDEIAHQVTTIY